MLLHACRHPDPEQREGEGSLYLAMLAAALLPMLCTLVASAQLTQPKSPKLVCDDCDGTSVAIVFKGKDVTATTDPLLAAMQQELHR